MIIPKRMNSLIILVQRRGDSTLKDTNKIGCYAWLTVKCVRVYDGFSIPNLTSSMQIRKIEKIVKSGVTSKREIKFHLKRFVDNMFGEDSVPNATNKALYPSKSHIFAHLVQGTPPILITFIVCIVTIRKVIHPLTLAVRLAANMIAGHLLLTLLGNTGPIIINSTILIQILILSQILLLILELAVSIIQSYVFTVLTTLYSR
ncbi:ATP synthase subunit a, partial [Gryllus bimaculatus]